MPVETEEAVLLMSSLKGAQLKYIKNQVRSKLILCLQLALYLTFSDKIWQMFLFVVDRL